ncbi:MAG: phosphoribosylformylglycinamidine cyclo-ligase [Patescibacteria group bacterium]
MEIISYKNSGVDIDAGNESVNRIKELARSTFSSGVLTGLGTFGAMFDPGQILREYKEPVLVQSMDGVGTKLKIAAMMDKFDTVGIDIVNHSCNDILAQGAKPLTFLDYIATGKLSPQKVQEIVGGMAFACKNSGLSLIGGETAEMPGVYKENEYDIAGCILGVAEKSELINGKNILPGDIVLGLASSGLHTNGYSLARKLFFEVGGYNVNSKIFDLEKSLGEELLVPHKNYSNEVLPLVREGRIKGIAHITGGGFFENIPRILPEGTAAEIIKNAWEPLKIFKIMQKLGGVPEEDMFRTFNMGIGMALVVAPENFDYVKEKTNGILIGKIINGKKEVILI